MENAAAATGRMNFARKKKVPIYRGEVCFVSDVSTNQELSSVTMSSETYRYSVYKRPTLANHRGTGTLIDIGIKFEYLKEDGTWGDM